MHSPFAPLIAIAIAQQGNPFTAPNRPIASGIFHQFRRLHEGAKSSRLRHDPGDASGDASCKKDPQDASPDFEPSPQPTEKEELTTPGLTTRPPRDICVSQAGQALSPGVGLPRPAGGRRRGSNPG